VAAQGCALSSLRVASFTVGATQEQSIRWKRAAESEGFRSVGAWLAEAADAYLKARARAGLLHPLGVEPGDLHGPPGRRGVGAGVRPHVAAIRQLRGGRGRAGGLSRPASACPGLPDGFEDRHDASELPPVQGVGFGDGARSLAGRWSGDSREALQGELLGPGRRLRGPPRSIIPKCQSLEAGTVCG
jgi:hypothetical protein